MEKFFRGYLAVVLLSTLLVSCNLRPSVYYIAPTGDDKNSGRSPNKPWASFEHAWKKLYPGDTLVLMDGVYFQTLEPSVRNGEPEKPITIKALHDGQARIDGENKRRTVILGNGDNPKIGHYFIVEGIVAQNSSGDVFTITGSHNILRRISGYNANTDTNHLVISIGYSSAQYNLVEDCVAAGTGRKMIGIWHGSHNTIRRCFADWQAWDGRDSCQEWPWGENIDIYGADNNIVENSIGYGSVPYFSITVRTNEAGYGASNNKVLGSIAIYAGMNKDGTPVDWPTGRPQPSDCANLRDWSQRGQRAGFAAYSSDGRFDGNVWQDIFAWGNAGHGFSAIGNVNPTNSVIQNATIYNNGLDNEHGSKKDGPVGTDILLGPQLLSITIAGSYIEGTAYNGPGARLDYRYIDGILRDGSDGQPSQPLWPWPMEERIQTELGISVTNEIYNQIIKRASSP